LFFSIPLACIGYYKEEDGYYKEEDGGSYNAIEKTALTSPICILKHCANFLHIQVQQLS